MLRTPQIWRHHQEISAAGCSISFQAKLYSGPTNQKKNRCALEALEPFQNDAVNLLSRVRVTYFLHFVRCPFFRADARARRSVPEERGGGGRGGKVGAPTNAW